MLGAEGNMKKRIQVDIGKYNQMVAEYHKESDRAAAVLAGSFVDEFTRKFIRSRMVDDKISDELLYGYGPLANFGARINTLYAFGFINKSARDDLDVIRQIRNHFAHHPEQTSFEGEEVIRLCGKLSTARPFVDDKGKEIPNTHERRFHYLMAIGLIVGPMHNAMMEWDKRRERK